MMLVPLGMMISLPRAMAATSTSSFRDSARRGLFSTARLRAVAVNSSASTAPPSILYKLSTALPSELANART